jgi:hypothetical protein
MSWYIGTLEEVTAYNEKVNEVKAYKGSITSNWANPRPHPEDDYYAIIAKSGIEPDEESSLQLVEKLGKDWFATEELP